MEEESSRSRRRPAAVAAVLGIAVFGVGAGFAVSGCGSDSNDTVKSVNNVIDSVQSQASSVQSQASSVSTQVQTAVQSVQSQAQSISTQIQQNQNGGSGQYGY
jgi:predicted PurR-regulated permease PerM